MKNRSHIDFSLTTKTCSPLSSYHPKRPGIFHIAWFFVYWRAGHWGWFPCRIQLHVRTFKKLRKYPLIHKGFTRGKIQKKMQQSSSWWFQPPVWKNMLVKLKTISPGMGVKINKCLKLHHPVMDIQLPLHPGVARLTTIPKMLQTWLTSSLPTKENSENFPLVVS